MFYERSSRTFDRSTAPCSTDTRCPWHSRRGVSIRLDILTMEMMSPFLCETNICCINSGISNIVIVFFPPLNCVSCLLTVLWYIEGRPRRRFVCNNTGLLVSLVYTCEDHGYTRGRLYCGALRGGVYACCVEYIIRLWTQQMFAYCWLISRVVHCYPFVPRYRELCIATLLYPDIASCALLPFCTPISRVV